MSCVAVSIVDDCAFEETEHFNLTLSTDDAVVILRSANRVATVFIEDNESKCVF